MSEVAKRVARDRTPEAGHRFLTLSSAPSFVPTRLIALVWSGVLVLVVQLFTLAPSVTGEDSGEFITAAWFFGVPHPPGYPLWTMLCGAWMHLLPIGSVAWRANVFSAVCTASAVVVLASTLIRLGFRPAAARTSAAASGLTATVWSQSVITEVYALNLLLVALMCWTLASWRRTVERRFLAWGSLIFGLAMANHHIAGFGALGLLIWGLALGPSLLRDGRLILKCALFFLIGLTPYLYMPWAARRDVPVKWGETTTLASAWQHVSRGQYKSSHPIEAPEPVTAGLMAGRLYYAVRWVVRDYTPILVPLIGAGLVWLRRRRRFRPVLWLFISLTLCSGPLYLFVGGPHLDRQDEFVQKVFLTPLALIFAVPLAAGIQWSLAWLRVVRTRMSVQPFYLVARAVLAGVVVVPLAWHFRENNMRHYWYAYDHAQNMLACMLPNAMIFPSGDHNTFPLIYLVHVEHQRPDVLIADKYGYIDPELYLAMPNNPGKPRTPQERDAIESWLIKTAHRPVYYTIQKPSLVEKAGLVQTGILFRMAFR